ncbi:twin-arginine translocation signal domain-containing protein [Bradyrhizobium sp.]|jgi:hypothetical protein|uniref:twin-arginine translocation signal domain-containing protein n=1 Tax=Bradyrhizobium sp. TaxID=376 RepID=UPI002BC177B0|nr:twin-arginine translocation signal domain-containing protein [Bradyrhizobium sp.]HWX60132.1 twin-arginine translocation signal domain-containing protein [Bradyrhizobium sp.]
MERRHFLKFALGLAAGTAMLTAHVEAAPLMAPGFIQTEAPSRSTQDVRPAVTSRDEVDRLTPEQVRWGHHWHHRHWGWHHRHHWGWRHHHWHRHWHHRHW